MSLVDRQTSVFAWDARGHGLSPGKRGDARHFGVFARDLDEFAKHVADLTQLDSDRIVVVGHSVGAMIVATWVHDYAPNIRGMILATPAFDVRLYVPFAKPSMRAWQKARPDTVIRSYVRPGMLTKDAKQAAEYANDELVSSEISMRVLLDMSDTANRIIADANTIHTPTLLLQAESDFVVNNKAQSRFFDRLASPVKRLVVLKKQQHAVFHELERDTTYQAVGDFVVELFEQDMETVQPDFRNADRTGVTYDEHQRLSKPLPFYCWKRALFATQRLVLHTVGRLSRGVQIGLETGFDSGVSLDHVYENKPAGSTVLGPLLDRCYLNAIGWKGIRQRRVHLQEQLDRAITQIEKSHTSPDESIRILDVARGGGRYVLDTIRNHPAANHIQAELRDFHQHNLDKCRATAAEWRLTNITTRQHDAFAAESYESCEQPFDIAIVSGLFELFPGNQQVTRALEHIRKSLRPGGILIYTNQPWHPQLETIARVLPSHQGGKSWIMRRRIQAEMDQLVNQCGFEKTAMNIDRWGIFTVATAKRSED